MEENNINNQKLEELNYDEFTKIEPIRKIVIEKRFNFDTHQYENIIKIKQDANITEIPFIKTTEITSKFSMDEINIINNCNLSLLKHGFNGLNEDEQSFLIDPESFITISKLQHLSGIV